ncbi:MAG: hypothetical protein KDD53_00210 [Bdellovibrionales bacterium]|nr:hypothetical protein [Bdellovibrionales bacterium]
MLDFTGVKTSTPTREMSQLSADLGLLTASIDRGVSYSRSLDDRCTAVLLVDRITKLVCRITSFEPSELPISVSRNLSQSAVAILDFLKSPPKSFSEIQGPAAKLLRDSKRELESFLRRVEDFYYELIEPVRRSILSGSFSHDKLAERVLSLTDQSITARTIGRFSAHRWYDDADIFLDLLFDIPSVGARETVVSEYGGLIHETPTRLVLQRIAAGDITSNDVFVDLGTRRGLLPIEVHLFSKAKTIGIEQDPSPLEIGRKIKREFNLESVELVEGDVCDFDYSSGTVFMMFNPFEDTPWVLEEVLEHLRSQAEVRQIRIWSLGACTHSLSKVEWLKCEVRDPSKMWITEFRAGS